MILLCLDNLIKRSRVKEAEQTWLIGQLIFCFILPGFYSILMIPSLILAKGCWVIALLCTSIMSIVLVFKIHIQNMLLRSRHGGKYFWCVANAHRSSNSLAFAALWTLRIRTCRNGWEGSSFLYVLCWLAFLFLRGGKKNSLGPGTANLSAMLGSSCRGESQIQGQDLSTMQYIS